MELDNTESSAPSETSEIEEASVKRSTPRKDYPFDFTGNSREYFRIWIVNILLTILTLGIYSAWAKVRNHRYFYGNTILDGSSFEYTAQPLQILKGRIVAVVIVLVYQGASFISTKAGLIAFGLLMLFIPALIVMSMRFRMRYTSWRNIQFGFKADFKAAYLLFGVPALLLTAIVSLPLILGLTPDLEEIPEPLDASQSIIQQLNTEDSDHYEEEASSTDNDYAENEALLKKQLMSVSVMGGLITILWLLFPWWQKLYYAFLASRSRYGEAKFHFIGVTTEFYVIYLIAMLVTSGAFILVALVVGLGVGIGAWLELPEYLLVIAGIFFMLPILVAQAYKETALTNIIYSNLELDNIGFRSQLKVGHMVYLFATNTLGILLSLGLLIPWAAIRMAKYRASTMTLYASDFEAFQAKVGADLDARGAEISDMMDIDIGI